MIVGIAHTIPMLASGSLALAIDGSLNSLVALARVACVLAGAPAYRFMGAGERMARAAEAGKITPTVVMLSIAVIFFVWAAYAFAGAGVIGRLPLARLAILAICAVYFGRALVFPLLKPAFLGNSQTFWLVSSGVCLIIGLVHVYGLMARWAAL